MGTCTVEDMIITDIENLQEVNLQEMPSDQSPVSRVPRHRHRLPSGERDEEQRRARSRVASTATPSSERRARSSISSATPSWHNQAGRHSRRTSSSCSRDHPTSSRRPSGEVSLSILRFIFRCYSEIAKPLSATQYSGFGR